MNWEHCDLFAGSKSSIKNKETNDPSKTGKQLMNVSGRHGKVSGRWLDDFVPASTLGLRCMWIKLNQIK